MNRLFIALCHSVVLLRNLAGNFTEAIHTQAQRRFLEISVLKGASRGQYQVNNASKHFGIRPTYIRVYVSDNIK